MERSILTIDAGGKPLGRLAVEAAKILIGKHKPDYNPRLDGGDFVQVKNLLQVKFTGNKMEQKLYYRPTRQPGRLRSDSLADLWLRNPKEILRKAVWGMLPKNSLRIAMIKRLSMEI